MPPSGSVVAQPQMASGRVSGVVRTVSPSVVVLSASYDPGWQATVNGHAVAVMAMAPALVGVAVPAGTSHVVFVYRGFAWYPELALLSCLSLLILWFVGRRSGVPEPATLAPAGAGGTGGPAGAGDTAGPAGASRATGPSRAGKPARDLVRRGAAGS